MGIDQNCKTNQTLKTGGYVKVGESMYITQVIIEIKTILNHIDTRTVLPRYGRFLCGVYTRLVLKCKTLHVDT